MSKSYARLHMILIGEPGDVRKLADSLKKSGELMGSIAGDTTNAHAHIDGGPTRRRCQQAVAELNTGIHASVESLGTSGEALSDWAGYIDETRSRLADLEHNLEVSEPELERKEAELRSLRLPEEYDRETELLRDIKELEQLIEHDRESARDKLSEYNKKAVEVGNMLYTDGLSSPAFNEGDRVGRNLLTFANDVAKVANWVSIGGGLLGKAGTKLGIEAFKRLSTKIAAALLVSDGVQLGAKATADLAGAKVSPLEYVFGGLKIGKTPARKYLDQRFGPDHPGVKAGDAIGGKIIGEGGKRAPKAEPPDPQPRGRS